MLNSPQWWVYTVVQQVYERRDVLINGRGRNTDYTIRNASLPSLIVSLFEDTKNEMTALSVGERRDMAECANPSVLG